MAFKGGYGCVLMKMWIYRTSLKNIRTIFRMKRTQNALLQKQLYIRERRLLSEKHYWNSVLFVRTLSDGCCFRAETVRLQEHSWLRFYKGILFFCFFLSLKFEFKEELKWECFLESAVRMASRRCIEFVDFSFTWRIENR